MEARIPDITKLAWQLNVSLVGAVFSAVSLIYNEKYIYFGFVTFLFGIVSHFFSTWFEFVYEDEELKSKRARFYYIQAFLVLLWICVSFFLNNKWE